MTVNTIRSSAPSSSTGPNGPDGDYGPYSIHNNWRVSNDLPEFDPSACPPKPINRNWLTELLAKYPNATTPSNLKGKALVVAPMVDQSDLPFRLQCRKYGANICVTPMIHARLFQENDRYRSKFLCDDLPKLDRPVIAQLCGPDPMILLKTALEVAPFVDGIDLNCGCPQGIAKRGLYGAFLLEEPELLVRIVQTLVQNLDIPVCVKVRLLPTGLDDSLQLYTKLVDCGISMLTIHGRTRLATNYSTGAADWDSIKQAVDLLGHRLPILANGGIANLKDVRDCLHHTGADGVMSSEAILEYPPLFCDENFHLGYRSGPGRLELAREYLELAKQYPPDQGGQGSGFKSIRAHIHKFIHADLQLSPEFRTQCVNAEEWEQLESCLDSLQQLHTQNNHSIKDEKLHWYRRHQDRDVPEQSQGVRHVEIAEDTADCLGGLFGAEDNDDDDDY
jgi:tRNA-dihydrouridine synthase 1